MKTMKKLLCAVLAVVMLFGMLPVVGITLTSSASSVFATNGIVLEAEDCAPVFSGGWWQKNVNHGEGTEGHGTFTFVQAAEDRGQTVGFSLSVESAGEYEIYAVTKDANTRGIFDFSIDDKTIGTVDFYNPQSSGIFLEHKLGTASLREGENILLATLNGRNPTNTSNYGCAFDYFRLVSTEDKSIYLETETLDWTVSEGWSKATKGHGAGVENHGTFDYIYTYSVDGQSVTYSLPVEETGNYVIYSMSKDGTNRAMFQFSVNGEAIGSPVDQYNAANGSFVEHKVGVATLKEGKNDLTITISGKNKDLTGSQLNGTFDYFRLVPTDEAPDTHILLECESVTWTLTGTWNQKNQTHGTGAEGHGKFGFVQTTSNKGQAVSFPVTVAKAGNYKIFLGTKDDKTRGKFNVSVNGTSLGEMDQYAPSSLFTEHELGIATLSSETNTITFTLIGKNSANTSSNFGGTFDYFRLIPTDEIPAPEYVAPELIYDESFDTIPEDFSDWELIDTFDGKAIKGTTLLNTLESIGKIKGSFTLAADFLMINDGAIGLTFAKTDDKNFHHFRVQYKYGDMVSQLYQWSDNKSSLITQNNIGAKEMPIRLRVTYDGRTLNCYVDGVLVLSNDVILSEGNVGFRLYDAVALIDNLQIYTGVVVPPEGGETSTDFAMDTEVQILNNEDIGYSETEGSFVSVSGGQNGSEARVSEGGSLRFDAYPSVAGTNNYILSYYLPASDGGTVEVNAFSLNGIWKYTIPENAPEGWYKLGIITATDGTAVSITASSEGKLYADAVKLEETLFEADAPYSSSGLGGSTDVAVLVNQIGYDCGTSKRATITNVADGTLFQLISVENQQVVFSGAVVGNIADFTSFDTDADLDFYIECAGARSFEFTIGKHLIQRRSVVNALAFMNQTRSDTFEWGTMKQIAWRDGAQFSFELNGLVLQYMANPAVYDAMEYGIVEVDTCQYEELRVQDEPDIVWLIQFGALRYYDWGCLQGKNLHMLTKEQLAYYLYLYPAISQYVPYETYEAIRDYTLSVWGTNRVDADTYWQGVSGTNHDLFALQTVFGGLKGSQPPGHSIVPNLMMYEVAKRDGLGDELAQKFFDAAYINAEYLIGDEFDLNDPFYNKGQRMSETITVPALCYFLEEYPEKAPEGLKSAIERWAAVTILRGDNMWDVRKAVAMAAGDGQYFFHNPNMTDVNLSQDYWTGGAYATADKQAEYFPGHGVPQNEPGNLAGLQAITYAAARILGTGETSDRLKALGVAGIDNIFGRNPTGRAAFYDFIRDFEGGDLGWYTQFRTGYGMLGGLTAVIDGSAPEASYPYAPENYNTGYTEGWVAYNSAWNQSLAYAAADGISLSVNKNTASVGETLIITLSGPLNLDSDKIETAYVFVKFGDSVEKILVTEQSENSDYFTAEYLLSNAGETEFTYGYGIFEHSVTVTAGTPEVKEDLVVNVTVKLNDRTLKAGDITVTLTGNGNEYIASNDADGKVSFTIYSEDVVAGTYTLIQSTEIDGITLADAKTFTVELNDNGNGELIVTLSNSNIIFENTYRVPFQEGEIKDGKYYVNGKGKEMGLFKHTDGNYYYAGPNGKLVVDQKYFAWRTNENCDLPEGNYFFDVDGKLYQGIYMHPEKGDLFFFENGKVKEKGLFKYTDGNYYFSQYNGLIVTAKNYTQYGTGKFYVWKFDESAADIKEGWYFFGEDGAMLQGIQMHPEKNDLYYFVNGKVKEMGLFQYTDGEYYFSQYNGKIVTSKNYTEYGEGKFYVWKFHETAPAIKEGWYFFGEDGAMLQGIHMHPEKNDLYFFENGKVKDIGFFQYTDGNYYCTQVGGKIITSNNYTQYGAGKYYVFKFHESVTDKKAGWYFFDETGKMITK